jgi:hypothetical protein
VTNKPAKKDLTDASLSDHRSSRESAAIKDIVTSIDLEKFVCDARQINHRLFALTVSVSIEDATADGEPALVNIVGALHNNMGGSTSGVVSGHLTHLHCLIKTPQDEVNETIYRVLTVEGVNREVDGFFNACRWYVDVQRVVEEFFPKEADGSTSNGVIGTVGFLGYAKLFSSVADGVKRKDMNHQESHQYVADAYLMQVDEMRMSGISPRGFVESLIRAMVSASKNINLVSIATGIPVRTLKSIAGGQDSGAVLD